MISRFSKESCVKEGESCISGLSAPTGKKIEALPLLFSIIQKLWMAWEGWYSAGRTE